MSPWTSLFVAVGKNKFPICRSNVPNVSQRCSLFVAPPYQSVAGGIMGALSIRQLWDSTNLDKYTDYTNRNLSSWKFFIIFFLFFILPETVISYDSYYFNYLYIYINKTIYLYKQSNVFVILYIYNYKYIFINLYINI